MEFEIVVAVQRLVEFVPVVYVDAFLVFIIVSALKVSGLTKKDPFPQLTVALLAFLFNGGKVPVGDYVTQKMFMTGIIAASMYHVWKFAKPYLKQLVDKLSEVMKK